MAKTSAFPSGAAASLRADLEKVDLDIVSLSNRLAEVRRSPVPADQIEARLDAWLTAEAAEAAGHMILSRFASPDFSIMERSPVEAFSEPRTSFGVLVALVGKGTILKSMLANTLKASPLKPMTDQEREREAAHLTDEVSRLERVREMIAREAENSGLAVARSEYADPAVLLAPDEEL